MKYKIKKYRNGNTVEWNTGPQFIPNPLPIEKPEDSPENIIDRSLGLMNPYEGFRSKVYDDKDPYRPYKGGKPKGTLTIGHGLTNPDIIKSFMNKEIDEQTSNNYQKEYINNDIIPALEKTSYYANLNPDQKASLISLVYNVGPTTFFKRSPKLQAALGANDWSEAVKHMDHGINQFKGLQQRRQAEQGTFMGDSVWTGNEYISKYVANPKYFKIGGKIRKHQIGQTVNWSTEPQGWKAYDEYKAKQNQIDFQNKVREANNPANNPLLNKPAPVVNQDWRNQDTYSNWQSRQRAKQAKYEQSAPYKIGTRLKEGAQVLSGSLGHFGMNIPFDIARSAGAKIPETMFSPTAFNDVNPNQSVGDFTKQIIGRGADIASFELGMGMIPGLVGGKALRNANPGMLTNNPVKSVLKTNNWNKVNQLEYDVKKKYGEVKRNINNSFENNPITQTISDFRYKDPVRLDLNNSFKVTKQNLNTINPVVINKVEESVQRELDWINSLEYLRRKKEATRLSNRRIHKDIATIKEQLHKTNIKLLPEVREKSVLGLYQSNKNTPKVSIFNVGDYFGSFKNDGVLNTIDHELKHAISETSLLTGDPLLQTRHYRNYPKINLRSWKNPLNLSGSKSWGSDPREQQVVSKRIMDIMEKDHNIKRGTKISTPQVDDFINGLERQVANKNISNSDVLILLQEINKKYGNTLKKNEYIRDWINRAY